MTETPFVNEGLSTKPAATALVANRVVVLNSDGKYAYPAAITDVVVGVTNKGYDLNAELQPWSTKKGYTLKMTANAAVVKGARLEPGTADGKVQTATTGTVCGIAATAASADGDIIEVITV